MPPLCGQYWTRREACLSGGKDSTMVASLNLQKPKPWGGDNRPLYKHKLYASASNGECPIQIDTSTPSCGTFSLSTSDAEAARDEVRSPTLDNQYLTLNTPSIPTVVERDRDSEIFFASGGPSRNQGGSSVACALPLRNSRDSGPAVRVYIPARPLVRNSQPTRSCASRLPAERTVHASSAHSPSQSQSSRRADSLPSHDVASPLPSWRSQR